MYQERGQRCETVFLDEKSKVLKYVLRSNVAKSLKERVDVLISVRGTGSTFAGPG